jgi:uncharacterized membrane protein
MSLRTTVRNSLVTGLALLAPLAITIVVLQVLYNWFVGYVDPIVTGTQLANYTANIDIIAQLLAAVLILAVVTVTGYVAQRGLGRRAFDELDEVMTQIPVVSAIYGGVREVSNTLMRGSDRYEKVVLVEWPREGVHSIGFVTNESPPAVQDAVGKGTYNVFIPMSPNPTAGHLAVVPEERITEIDMTVRRGLRMVFTTGLAESDEAEIKDMEQLYTDDELSGDYP